MTDTPANQDFFDAFDAAARTVIGHYKEAARDGLSVAEVWRLVSAAVASFLKLMDTLVVLGDADKKEAALQFAARLYDQVIAPLDIPRVPAFIENNFVDPAIRSLFLSLAAGLVDTLLTVFAREAGPAAPAAPAGFVPY